MILFKRKHLFRVCYESTDDGTRKFLLFETKNVDRVKEFFKTNMPGFKILEILQISNG